VNLINETHNPALRSWIESASTGRGGTARIETHSKAQAIRALIGGAFAATIAQWIVSTYGQSWLIGVYLVIPSAISLISVSLVKDPMGVDLNDKAVHDDYLHEHPELAAVDRGVAGS
jgi:hypothetical protein